MSSELTSLGLVQIRNLLRNGEITSSELTAACISRISATEDKIKALLARRDAEALEQAKAMDACRKQDEVEANPLWGVPLTVKDALVTKGLITSGASRMLEGYVPAYDAFSVSRLKQAGAVILGKTNLDEFAMGSTTENSAYHPTCNPWDLARVPGGSSGGSAASVAACQCFASLGADTGGSIRQPAALCGCVGVKPTYGRVSRFGLLAYASSLDQVGTLARSVEDAALLLQVVAGHDKQDSTSVNLPVPDYLSALAERRDLKGLKLGLPKEYLANAALDPGVAEVCQQAFETARQLGAELVEVSLPHSAYAIAAYYIISSAEAGSNLACLDGVRYGHRAKEITDLYDLYAKTRTEAFGQEVQRRILLGAYVLSAGYYDAYYRKAAQVRRLVRQDFEQALNQCDLLLAPVCPVTAWTSGSLTDPLQLYQMDVFTLPLNMAGLPGLSIPAGLSAGLPVGVQLMGRSFDESLLFQAGNVLTKALGTEGQHAPL